MRQSSKEYHCTYECGTYQARSVIISTLTSRLASHRIQIVVTPFASIIPTRGFNKQCRTRHYPRSRYLLSSLSTCYSTRLNGREKSTVANSGLSALDRDLKVDLLYVREIRITNPRKILFLTPPAKYRSLIFFFSFFFFLKACLHRLQLLIVGGLFPEDKDKKEKEGKLKVRIK